MIQPICPNCRDSNWRLREESDVIDDVHFKTALEFGATAEFAHELASKYTLVIAFCGSCGHVGSITPMRQE